MSYKILDERDIDLKYSSNSENAQSGKAVAEALATVGGAEKEWELIEDITLTESVAAINLSVDKINTKNEVHIEAYVVPTDTTITNQQIQFNDGSPIFQTNVNCKATGKVYVIMDIYKSPKNTPIFDGTISAYDYTVGGASFKITKIDANLSGGNAENLLKGDVLVLRTSSTNLMAAGTRVKVWGR